MYGMKRTIYVSFIIFICGTLLTGCWSRRELNDLSIAFALGLDYIDGEHVVTVQIINPSEIATTQEAGGGQQTPVATYQTKGATLFEALRRMTKIVPRRVYLAYVRIVVIGESLAQRGIIDALDLLLREHEFRTDFYLLVAKHSPASEMLNVLTLLIPIPAMRVFDSLKMSQRFWAATGIITIDELLTEIIEGGKQPVLTGMEIVGDLKNAASKENVERLQNKATPKLTDMAAFHGDKMVGWLNEIESKGYNYTQGEVKNTITTVPCSKEGVASIEILRTDGTVQTQFTNGQLRGQIMIDAEGDIGDIECGIDLSQQKTIRSLQKRTEQKIRETVVAALEKTQKELHTDIFGFGDALSRSHPVTWRAIKNEWHDHFIDLPVDIIVKVDIRGQGAMSKSIKEIMKDQR